MASVMPKAISSVMPFVIWILCILMASFIIGYCIKYGSLFDPITTLEEGFTTNIRMTSCPLSATSYITHDGDTNCCDGDIVNKKCNGRNICSLSPKPPAGMMSCSDWMNQEWARRSARFCMPSMPNYFGPLHRDNKAIEGCSESMTVDNGTEPQVPTAPRCKIYSSEGQDRSNLDSCYNARYLARLAPGGKPMQISLPVSGQIPQCIDTNTLNNNIIPALKPYIPKITDLIQKDPCSLSGVLPICGTDCSKDVVKLPSSFRPRPNTVIGKATIAHNYSLSFDMTPLGAVGDWGNLLHFTVGSNCCDFGSRAPGIWFAPGTINTFAIHVGHQDDGGWAARPTCDAIKVNTKISFKLECRDSNITVTIGNSTYTYSKGGKRYAGDVTVYSADPWHAPANVLIENISYTKL